MSESIMIIRAIKTRVFREGEDLFHFITSYFRKIPEKSVIVITSKIVSLAEKRTAIVKNKREKENLIRRESDFAIPTKYAYLTIKDGQVLPSSGVDESNAKGKVILLPKDSFETAKTLRKKLQKKYKVKKLGVLITDSRTLPLRAGVIGTAVGYDGFLGIKDYRGKSDIFGRRFKFSRQNIADGLATAAILVMGEGREKKPLAIIREAPIKFTNRSNRQELYISLKEDIYRPLFSKFVSKFKDKSKR